MVTNSLVASKRADLAGPGIGNYKDVERALPRDCASCRSVRPSRRSSP